MTKCSLQTSQASTAAEKLVQVQYEPSSVALQSCTLDLVQHYLPIRFGRETSNMLSVIKLQKNVFLHWCQQQSFISRYWPTVERSFDFTNASLEKPLSIGLMEPGLWPVAPDEFESGGSTRPAQSAGKKFSWRRDRRSVQFVVCSSRCPMESAPLFVAMLWVAVISHLTLAALTRLFGSGIPHTLVPCFNPLPPI